MFAWSILLQNGTSVFPGSFYIDVIGTTHHGYDFVYSVCEDDNAIKRFLALYCRADVFKSATRQSVGVKTVSGGDVNVTETGFRATNTVHETSGPKGTAIVELADINSGRGIYRLELAREDYVVGFTSKPYDFTGLGICRTADGGFRARRSNTLGVSALVGFCDSVDFSAGAAFVEVESFRCPTCCNGPDKCGCYVVEAGSTSGSVTASWRQVASRSATSCTTVCEPSSNDCAVC